VIPAGPAVKPGEFDVEPDKPKPKPVVNIVTGETAEKTKKSVTLDSYKPIGKIDIGGKKFDLPI
jgi:hypothetical protein